MFKTKKCLNILKGYVNKPEDIFFPILLIIIDLIKREYHLVKEGKKT